MTSTNLSLETKAVHAGALEPRVHRALVTPIFQSATFEFGGEACYDDIRYARLSNTPSHEVLHRRLAALENADSALVAASGMAAITTALLTALKTGDHLLAQSTLYGGTHDFIVNDLPRFGIAADFIDAARPDTWKSALRKNTKVIYVETISNPLMGVGDLREVAPFARANGLTSMIDNTFASPVNFRPFEHGFDLSLHSATKYLNGHSDLAAGAVIGGLKLVKEVTHRLNHLGGSLDPHACFLLERGLKTLVLRVRHQNESALRIARMLRAHPKVETVNYPGLEDHQSHALARKALDGFGGMLSFEIAGDVAAAQRFIERLRIPVVAPSLGGVESLVTRPATTSHVGLTPEQRRKAGISDRLIRLSVGIESAADLIADLEQALGAV